MLPKILRMRLEAIDRFSVARAVLIAMEMCLAFSRHPGASRDPCVAGAARDAKSRVFPHMETAASASCKTPTDQCVERAARRRVLFRCDGVWALDRGVRGRGQ